MNQVGFVLWRNGDLTMAETLFRRRLAIVEEKYGPENKQARHRVNTALVRALLLLSAILGSACQSSFAWVYANTSMGLHPVQLSQGFRRSKACTVCRATATAASAAAPDPAGQQLLDWLDSEGALVSTAIRISVVPPLGRELLAVENIDAGSELIRLPAELCLAVPSENGPSHLPEDVRLAAEILRDVGNEDGMWPAYRNVLPSRSNLGERLPIFWHEGQLGPFADRMPGLAGQVESRRQLLSRAAAALQVPLAELTWAHALVSTRAVGAGIGACAMLPGIDVANHGLKPNAELVVAGEPGIRTGRATVTRRGDVWEHGTAGLLALHDISAGEPVRISYGSYANQRLLLDYGFDLGSDNPKGDQEVESDVAPSPAEVSWPRSD